MKTSALAPWTAQVGAELRMRLRSLATPVALLVLLVGAFLWIPNPKGNVASIAWDLPDGRVQAPVYSAAYVGFALAILSGIFLALAGFYLVAGSVRRDRERGVGAILAATPLSKSAYLGGKFAAHFTYLLVLDGFALLAGVAAFARYGAGRFTLTGYLAPYLLLTIPALAFVAALAVLFDVTPGLRSRGGLVLWFFVFLFGLVKLPLDLAGVDLQDGAGPGGRMSRPVFDPGGMATEQWLIRQTIPRNVKGVSTGHIAHAQGIERVPWNGVPITPPLVGIRFLNLAFALVPLALAVLIFDRFDPARGRRRMRRPGFLARLAQRSRGRTLAETPEVGLAETARLTPVHPRPSASGAVLAEARLIWESASWIKWPMAAAAILAGFVPGPGAPAVLLVLLIPVVAEVAAREQLSGTRSLVFSQPAIPSSVVLWKAAALWFFVLTLGTPMTIRSFAISPVRGLACAAGLLAMAGAAVGLGWLSTGGKLFIGLSIAAWYMAVSGAAEADWTSSLAGKPVPIYSLAHLGAALLVLAAAAARERFRASAA